MFLLLWRSQLFFGTLKESITLGEKTYFYLTLASPMPHEKDGEIVGYLPKHRSTKFKRPHGQWQTFCVGLRGLNKLQET